jgi:protein-disulfide isomerase
VLIPVHRADEPRARRVGGLGHGARERRRLDIGGEHDHVLAGLDAGAHVHGQVGQALHSRVHCRQRTFKHMLQPLDERVDHVRGPHGAALILEYGDYECPYSRRAYREIQHVEARLCGHVRFAFRHFPLTEIHPHALAASRAAEAAAAQGRYWEMHDLLFHRQKALEDDDLRRYAEEVGLDVARFDRDRAGEATLERVERDFRSGLESGQVRGTPTLFIDGVVHDGAFDAETLSAALAR